MTVLLLFILGAAFAVSALTYSFYWYEALNLDREAFDPRAHGGRLRLALAGFASSLASQAALIVTYPFGFMRMVREPAVRGDKTGPPVVLVHGIYHNGAAWLLFRRRLARRGYRTLHSFCYSSFGPAFGEIAAALGRKIRTVSEENGGAKVVLIGHSMGGLLIRAALGEPQTAARALAVVTLGTPFRGSKLAALGVGSLSAGLVPGSPLLRNLPPFPDPEKTPWLCLASPADNMVLPPSGLTPDMAGPVCRQTPVVCHVGMIYHKPTFEMALSFLDETVRGQGGAAS
ncbi:MAG: alpha/beta fold hydrolase [Desulfovibrionaceae bacterium]|nr:alpha/beta fold hydrolase [Desulfovibrionaceae bacterium]MBF0513598.1 alpha/beta fold hydrolase [Desulfovibrionaceae bacterium]